MKRIPVVLIPSDIKQLLLRLRFFDAIDAR